MAEEREITVACEACGEKELVITKESSEIFSELDLFVCPRCVYAWNTIDRHVKNQQLRARTGRDHEDFHKNMTKLVDIARESLLKKSPLPRIREKTEPKDRLDSIILLEDENG